MALYIFCRDKKKIKYMMDNTSSGGFCANDTIVHAAGNHAALFTTVIVMNVFSVKININWFFAHSFCILMKKSKFFTSSKLIFLLTFL